MVTDVANKNESPGFEVEIKNKLNHQNLFGCCGGVQLRS